jgi:hypothetical protein
MLCSLPILLDEHESHRMARSEERRMVEKTLESDEW